MEATLGLEVRDNSIKTKEEQSLEKEWLEVNGLGAYSSSNLLNCHTRKYHGLLVVPKTSIADREVLISKFEEMVTVDEEKFFLNQHYYEPGVSIPLNEREKPRFYFDFDIYPRWTFEIADCKVTKEVLMPWGENTCLIKYRMEGSSQKSLKLILKPLLAFKNFHSSNRENSKADLNAAIDQNFVRFKLYPDNPDLFIQFNCKNNFTEEKFWYKNFLYRLERERGYEYIEDLACTGTFEIDLNTTREFIVAVSTQEQKNSELDNLWNNEIYRRESVEKSSLVSSFGDLAITLLGLEKNNFEKKLKNAALKFLVKPNESSFSVIAGYHWFGEWGRDTMISLPGLLMNTGYEKAYIHTIRRFLDYKQDGLIPNIIGNDKTDSAYNSIDGSLWLFWTIQQFLQLNNDHNLIKDFFWEDLKDIFTCYAASIPKTVKFHENGLISSGSETDSMTWMDACINGKSVIPRYGFIVEINALWYNAVCFTEELAIKFKDPILERCRKIKNKIEESFVKTFYMPEYGYLADYVRDSVSCTQLRPNQLFALSLPYSLIPTAIAEEVINSVENNLLTPFGLRTLSPEDPAFCSKYQGDQEARDHAYHNGTVWPWLLGAYGDALMKFAPDKAIAKTKISVLIRNFESHFKENGVGSIAEIFDATEPYNPQGCIAQAWSVAEIRRLIALIK